METDNPVKVKSRKSRLSLFTPANITVPEVIDKNSEEIEYIKKIKDEEKSWKQIYEESKENRKKLLKELDTVKTKPIDYDMFDAEDKQFLNAKPNFEKFVATIEDFQNILKVARIQTERVNRRKNILCNQIEQYSKTFETELCNKISK